MGTNGVVTRRELNRALLARQHLLERATMPALDMVTHLVGLQAQAQNPPYYGLWCRIADFRQDELSTLITDRSVVRIAVMRGTVHLIAAADCALLRPAVQTVLMRGLRANRQYRAGLDGMDLAALADAARELVEQQPRTLAELRVLLGERWPDRDAESMAYGARCLLPLVQVPPRGIWGVGGQPSCTTAESWLGLALDERPALDAMVLRYLAAFGPASVADVQTWSGLTRLREVVEPLRERLWVGRDENDVEVFDLPDAPRPDADTPAPVRLVAEFDNLVLSHADRSRVISEDGRRRLFTANGVFPGTVLVDGFVAASWRLAARSRTATLTVTPFVTLAAKDRRAITAEGTRMLAFAAPDAVPEVVFNALD